MISLNKLNSMSCCCSGYSVGAGNFLNPASVEVVGGAPQYHQKGKVGPIFSLNVSIPTVDSVYSVETPCVSSMCRSLYSQ